MHQIIWKEWLVHEKATAFPGTLFCCAPSSIPTILGLDAIKLLCGISLSFQVALAHTLTYFNSYWCFSVSLLLLCTLESSTKSSSAAEYDHLTESAISLSCLLQDYLDVCNGPVIQIITMIGLFRDLLPSLSAFVDLSLNFTENKKLNIYWNNTLRVQEKPKIYVSYQSHYDVMPSKNRLSLCSDVMINEKIRFLQIYERHEESWNWLNWYLKQCDLLSIYLYQLIKSCAASSGS